MSAEPQLIFEYLTAMNQRGASDLYLTVGQKAMLRIDDKLISISEKEKSFEDINGILNAILTNRQRRDYDTNMELNTALDMGNHGRFRVNVMKQRQAPALVIRRIISKIPSFEDLRLPKIFENLSMEKRGLVLLTGMTGSGKSTSLAAMVDHRNMNAEGHIITIEDPIEYYHEHKKSVVSQREVGVDTESFAIALKNSLRQRPDVILVGEIRDREVMEQALTVAETGHLCLATIHTNNSYQAIERIVNFFPEDLTHQVRLNLSMNLKAVISQRLIHDVNQKLTPAIEVMLNQGLIRELILKGHISKIKEVMEQNIHLGMCTFDQSLLELVSAGIISEEVALVNSDKPSDMKIRLKQAQMTSDEEKSQTALSAIDTSIISFRD